MHVPHYLTLSRHQVYYFRFPIPAILHPEGKPSHIRLSLETRCPKEALRLARGLAYLGDRLLSNPAVQNMNHSEIRAVLHGHFKELREQVKAKLNRLGPFTKQEKLAHEKAYGEALEAYETENYEKIATKPCLAEIINRYDMPIKAKSPAYQVLQREYVLQVQHCTKSILEWNADYERVNFSTDPANGYGRNLGRWFNETLLVKLKIKRPELVFHSFRHTFSTRLARAGVDLSLIRRLVGHVESDTLNKYYLKGPLMPQLKEVVEKL